MNIVNKKDKDGHTPLGQAIQNEGENMLTMVETLLKAGANPNLKCSEHTDYAYPIDFAVSYYIRMFAADKYKEMAVAKKVIQLLINNGAKETSELRRILKREEGDLNWQPFVDDLKFMFGINESIEDETNRKDNYGNVPLDYALSDLNVEIVELLLKHGANPEGKGTSLIYRVFVGEINHGNICESRIKKTIKVIKLLLKYGADKNARLLSPDGKIEQKVYDQIKRVCSFFNSPASIGYPKHELKKQLCNEVMEALDA